MKKNKLSRSIILILVTVFVLVIGTIILGIFFSNKSMAVTCSQCNGSQITITKNATGHTITCQDQSCHRYGMPITNDHTWGTPVCTPQSKRYTSKRNSMYSMWLCKNRNCN